MNLVMEDVKEFWTEFAKSGLEIICFYLVFLGKGKKKAKPENKQRYIAKLFLRGDSIVLIVRNPKG
jgi:small nuclear ribonucleoprotein D2